MPNRLPPGQKPRRKVSRNIRTGTDILGRPSSRKAEFSGLELAFIRCYAGNGIAAAEKAGYKGNKRTLHNIVNKLLKDPKIVDAIKNRPKPSPQSQVADRRRRQAFWTQIMEDDFSDLKERLRASELLGKSEGDFIDRVEHSGKMGIEALVAASGAPTTVEAAVVPPALPARETEDPE